MVLKKMIMSKKYSWIFFDLDGTLADSIPAMVAVYHNFLSEFKRSGTKEDFEELNGPSLSEVISILKARHHLIEDEAILINYYQNKISELYEKIHDFLKE